MNEKIQSDVTLTSGKAAYEKPVMQVYEMQLEGSILQTSGGNPPSMDYDYDEDDTEHNGWF